MNLAHLFVFNPTLSKHEDTEHEKIIFYHPDSLELGMKQRNVGLAEAIVNFTRQFSPQQTAEFLHSQKKKYIFINPEPNFHMIMVG